MLEQGCLDVNLVQGEKILVEGMPHAYVIYLREGCAKIHMIGPRGSDQVKACYIKVEVFNIVC